MKASTGLLGVACGSGARRTGKVVRLTGAALAAALGCLGPDASAQVFDAAPAGKTPARSYQRPARAYIRPAGGVPAANAPTTRAYTQRAGGVTTADTPPTSARRAPTLEAETPLGRTAAFYQEYIDPYVAERLTLGLRLVNNKLDETSRPADRDGGLTFLGYVNELEQQEKSGVRLVVGYRFCPYFSVEVSHDEVAARTRNYNTGLSDGVLRLSGPVFAATLSYPVTDKLSPYVGLGYAPWSASFEHDDWWHLDYDSPEAYEAHGSPRGVLFEDRSRCIEVEDDSATFFTLGVAYRFHRHAQLDVMMRQIDLTSKARFYYDYAGEQVPQREGEFTMKHSTFGIALSFVF
ncbi:MAG: outer membrane beta-barrel protein [Lentisphaerae bacterium]|jgi:hypothetical protein|nr:outer membrane beta-barrel protein [Lentisphaerota bacterium]